MKEVGIKFCFIEGYKPKGERSAREGKSSDEFQGVTLLYILRRGEGDAGGSIGASQG